MADEKDSLQEAALLAPGLIHEMRHPLMGLKAAFQLMQSALGSSLTDLEEWPMVQGQLLRLEELFRCYQDFLTPERVVARPFSVAEVVNRAVELLRYRLRRLGDRFGLEVTPTLMTTGSPSALLHGVTNLLVNALDAIEEAGGGGRILLRAFESKQPDGHLEVRISDSGPGIPVAIREKIFEPSFTTKPPGKGTGLGLSIARRMLQASGGDAVLVPDSDPLRAPWAKTEFALRLTDPYEKASPPSPEIARSSGPAVLANRPRALVVDDERIIVALLRKTLEGEDIEVSHAYTADAALKLLETQSFDLLVTDKNLPGGNGVDLAVEAKRRNPAMGILMITAYASRESADRMLETGIDEYLQKPFEADYLARRVKQIISRRRALTRGGGGDRQRTQVAVLVSTPDQTERVSTALDALSLSADHLKSVESPRELDRYHGMVLSTLQGRPKVREVIWRLQEERPGFPIVLLSDGRALEDTIVAILLGAVGGLVESDDVILKSALAQAFGDCADSARQAVKG